ncbi:MAG: isoprenylcysteine carboxylmethyltransferase family protein [Pontiellaceae bacterium]|nr:isoprenylcysteine carboxylmethyltransferase family protein [Pontiellaceae bacterium]
MKQIRNHLLSVIIATLTLSTSTSLYALSNTIEISPAEPEAEGFYFEIKTTRISNGKIKFQVEIEEKTAKFSTAPSLSLGTFDETDNSVSISSTRKLEFSLTNGVIQTMFTVPKRTVNKQRNCLIFTNYDFEKKVPSKTFYIVRLNRFLPEQTNAMIYIIITLLLLAFFFVIKSLKPNSNPIYNGNTINRTEEERCINESFFTALKRTFCLGPFLLGLLVLLEVAAFLARRALPLPLGLGPAAQVLLTLLLGSVFLTANIGFIRAHLRYGVGKTLITTGPFAFVRHPLYAADIFALPGLAAVWGNDLWLVAVWLLMLAVLPLFTRREERFMERHFGEAYRRYRERVPAFIPWRGRVGL